MKSFKERKPLVPGERFARLVVLHLSDTSTPGNIEYLCQCDCGNFTLLTKSELRRGGTKSCGCLRKSQRPPLRMTHGYTSNGITPKEYKIWIGIKTRTMCQTHRSYQYYGARGIKICDRWINSFENFYSDMGPMPTPKHTIERIDNDGHYEPLNCIWATQNQQSNNKRSSRLITYQGKTQNVQRWSEELNIPRYIIFNRLNAGWKIEAIFTVPIKKVNLNQLYSFQNKSLTLKEWSNILGIKRHTLYARIHIYNWSIEKAFRVAC